jgi:hypothetical protein
VPFHQGWLTKLANVAAICRTFAVPQRNKPEKKPLLQRAPNRFVTQLGGNNNEDPFGESASAVTIDPPATDTIVSKEEKWIYSAITAPAVDPGSGVEPAASPGRGRLAQADLWDSSPRVRNEHRRDLCTSLRVSRLICNTRTHSVSRKPAPSN